MAIMPASLRGYSAVFCENSESFPMLKKLLVIITAITLSWAVHAQTDAQKAAIAERIKPAGSVCLQGDAKCGAAAAAAGPRSGEDIYKTACLACHDTGAAGAPKKGDKAAWKPRIAQGIDTVYGHAINGFKGMPPKGTCMTCSDDDIKATVDFMVEASK
jgi:cytochrome c5